MEPKSPKELAFLYDLYIGTDWAERFAALVDERVELPKEGRALYVAAGTAGHALALKERDEDLTCCVWTRTPSAWKSRRPKLSHCIRKPSFSAKIRRRCRLLTISSISCWAMPH